MYIATTLRTEALLVTGGDAEDTVLASAMLTDAAFAGALRVLDHGRAGQAVVPGRRAEDPALPACLAALAWEAADGAQLTPEQWTGPVAGWARAAVLGETEDWWGNAPAITAVARHRARTAVEAACAGDGDAPANALALLLARAGWLDAVRERPCTRSEHRRLTMAGLDLPLAPAAFVAAASPGAGRRPRLLAAA